MNQSESSQKIPVYLIPGMAASSRIFEFISLPKDQFEVFTLDWITPLPSESLQEYALRMSIDIKRENPVLIGVSFGGILAQELSRLIRVRKVIIISSVKSKAELPKRMKLARVTGIHHLLPARLLQYLPLLNRMTLNKSLKARIRLYSRYMYMPHPYFVSWAMQQVVHWNQSEPVSPLLHIHGDRDPVFPGNRIKNCITVKGGTHTMIIHRYKWFNQHLPGLILIED